MELHAAICWVCAIHELHNMLMGKVAVLQAQISNSSAPLWPCCGCRDAAEVIEICNVLLGGHVPMQHFKV